MAHIHCLWLIEWKFIRDKIIIQIIIQINYHPNYHQIIGVIYYNSRVVSELKKAPTTDTAIEISRGITLHISIEIAMRETFSWK